MSLRPAEKPTTFLFFNNYRYLRLILFLQFWNISKKNDLIWLPIEMIGKNEGKFPLILVFIFLVWGQVRWWGNSQFSWSDNLSQLFHVGGPRDLLIKCLKVKINSTLYYGRSFWWRRQITVPVRALLLPNLRSFQLGWWKLVKEKRFLKRKKLNTFSSGKAGDEVYLCGWVRSKRTSKACAFIALNDGSCQATIQLVIDNDSSEFGKLSNVGTGASLGVAGKLVESPAKGQAVEVQVKELTIFGEGGADYPLQKKGHSLEFLGNAHLGPNKCIWKCLGLGMLLIYDYFQKKEFIWAHTPLLTASDGGCRWNVPSHHYGHGQRAKRIKALLITPKTFWKEGPPCRNR